MCQHISLKVVSTDDDIQVLGLLNEDSHTKIHAEFKIADNFQNNEHSSIEVVPTTDLINTDTWEIIFDTPKPNWWNSMVEEKVREKVKELHSHYWNPKTKTYTFKGYLYLRSLTSIPEGVTLNSGGDLNLYSLTSIPKGVTLKSGGYLNLFSLTSIPKGVKVKAKKIALNA